MGDSDDRVPLRESVSCLGEREGLIGPTTGVSNDINWELQTEAQLQ